MFKVTFNVQGHVHVHVKGISEVMSRKWKRGGSHGNVLDSCPAVRGSNPELPRPMAHYQFLSGLLPGTVLCRLTPKECHWVKSVKAEGPARKNKCLMPRQVLLKK